MSAVHIPGVFLPRRIGPYEVQREIGRGGTGIVLAARSEEHGEVALKVLHGGPAPEELAVRLEREAAVLRRIDHPGIVRVYDAGRIGPWLYLAMERVQGEDLESLQDRAPLPLRRGLEVLGDVAQALEEVHRHGAVHRDLTPRNIVVRSDGRPVLTDFGFALDLRENERVTREGVMMGTLGFASPEQMRGGPAAVDPRSDVYSLGAVLCWLLTGRPPFLTKSQSETLRRIFEDPPEPPSATAGDVSPRLDRIVLTALAKRPEERYASAEAFARAIRGFLEEAG